MTYHILPIDWPLSANAHDMRQAHARVAAPWAHRSHGSSVAWAWPMSWAQSINEQAIGNFMIGCIIRYIHTYIYIYIYNDYLSSLSRELILATAIIIIVCPGLI